MKKKKKKFKKYRNKITDLLRIRKQSHYQQFFEANKKTQKFLCQGIHNLIYSNKNSNKNSPCSLLVIGKTLTNPESMAEEFNEFYTSIVNDLKKKISPTIVAKIRNICYISYYTRGSECHNQHS